MAAAAADALGYIATAAAVCERKMLLFKTLNFKRPDVLKQYTKKSAGEKNTGKKYGKKSKAKKK